MFTPKSSTTKMSTLTTSVLAAKAMQFYREVTITIRPLEDIAHDLRISFDESDGLICRGIVRHEANLRRLCVKLEALLNGWRDRLDAKTTKLNQYFFPIDVLLYRHLWPAHEVYEHIAIRMEGGVTGEMMKQMLIDEKPFLVLGGEVVFDRVLREIQALRWNKEKYLEVKTGHDCCDLDPWSVNLLEEMQRADGW